MGASPKRLEAAPYTVANLTRQRPEGNPLLSASAGEIADRPGREVRSHAGADADRDGESGFRSGRSRSGGRESVGVRDVLRRAPPVLRRRIRQLQLRRRLLGRPVLDVLLAACRPRAARHRQPARRRQRLHQLSDAVDDPRRREVDRPRRQVLGRRDVRGDPGRNRRRRRRPAHRSRRSSRRPATRSAAPAASSPTSRRSGSW